MIVRDLMTEQVVTLRRNDELVLADDLMGLARIRHLPVLDEEGALVGILSQRDLFRSALAQVLGLGAESRRRLLKTIAVKEIMTPNPITVAPDTPIAEASETLLRQKIGCLPVVEGERLVGILTESDFVRHVAKADQRALAARFSAR